MKFIHLSDLHIGKRVNEISMIEEQEHILTQILQIIDDETPDAVIIDTTCDTLKVIRAGANIDSYLRPHNTIAINYKTLEVISQN